MRNESPNCPQRMDKHEMHALLLHFPSPFPSSSKLAQNLFRITRDGKLGRISLKDSIIIAGDSFPFSYFPIQPKN